MTQKDLLIAAADTLSQISDAIARYYCGESKTLVPDGLDRWRVTWPQDGETLEGVEVRLKGSRYRFIAPAKPAPEKADDPEATLRALWTAQGVTQERQDQVLAEVTAAAQPGAKVGPFTIPYHEELTPAGPQLVIPGCERQTTTKVTAQLSLFA
jgi:hypothetical protein